MNGSVVRSGQSGIIGANTGRALFASDFAALTAGIGGGDLLAHQFHLPIEGVHLLANADVLSWGGIAVLLASSAGFLLRGHYTSRIPRRHEAAQIATTAFAATMLGMLVQS